MNKHLEDMRVIVQDICTQLNITQQPKIVLTNKLCSCASDDYYEAGQLNLVTRVIRVRYTTELWDNHKDRVMNALAHELMHWRQFQNVDFNEAEYSRVYDYLDEKVGYANNPLETDANEYADKLYPIQSSIENYVQCASQSVQKLIALI